MSKSIATVVGWYGGYPVIEPIDAWVPTVGAVLYSAPAPISWSAAAYYVDGKTYFPEEPPARKPLTDDEIKNALMVDPAPIYRLMTTGCIAGAELNEILKRVARAIERAHGITND